MLEIVLFYSSKLIAFVLAYQYYLAFQILVFFYSNSLQESQVNAEVQLESGSTDAGITNTSTERAHVSSGVTEENNNTMVVKINI